MSPTHTPSRLRGAGWAGALACCVLAGCLVTCAPAQAAISADGPAVTAVSSSNTTSLTWSHTVGSNSNRILIVSISFRDGNVSASSVTYGGAALTLIGAVNSGGNQNRTEIWYKLAPPTGTASVVINMTASKEVAGASVSYYGVSQTTPLGTYSAAGNNGTTTASVSVSSAAGQLVIDTVTTNGDANSLAVTFPALQTQLWNIYTGSGDAGNARGAGSTQPGAATTTMTWTLGIAKAWSIVAVPLIAAPSPSFVNLKTVQVSSDPINGSTNPKFIPGALALYTVRITNQGNLGSDSNSTVIVDAVPANTSLYVNDLGAVGSGPVAFADGSPSSALTYTFTSLASTTDDVDFSSNGGATYAYTPTPAANGCDASVTHIRINPKGTFAAASGGNNPYFTVSFKVCVK
jgi:hypothetical protein